MALDEQNPCPVCLEPIKEEAYLDQCFHKFCYSCIALWTSIVSNKHSNSLSSIRCPVCKSDNFSIVHGVTDNHFKRHYVNQDPKNSFLSGAHMFRWLCYDSEPGILLDKFNIHFYWKHRRYLKLNKWLEKWLTREIQTLTEVKDVDIIVHHILGVIESFVKRQPYEIFLGTPEQKRQEFKGLIADAAKQYVFERTQRFVDELEVFLVSGLNLEAYDKVYKEAMPASGLTSEFTEENTYLDPLLTVFEEIDGIY